MARSFGFHAGAWRVEAGTLKNLQIERVFYPGKSGRVRSCHPETTKPGQTFSWEPA